MEIPIDKLQSSDFYITGRLGNKEHRARIYSKVTFNEAIERANAFAGIGYHHIMLQHNETTIAARRANGKWQILVSCVDM